MTRLRYYLLLGIFKPRKTRPVPAGAHLIDGAGVVLIDADGNKLTG